MWAILNMVSNHACCHLFKMFALNVHQNDWFQVRFFKYFLGTGSPSSFLRPLPRFFSGFALGSGFALNSQALRAFDSASPSILGRFAPVNRASPSTFDWITWFGLQNKFLDPPIALSSSHFDILTFLIIFPSSEFYITLL